jgi:hypothetical protein
MTNIARSFFIGIPFSGQQLLLANPLRGSLDGYAQIVWEPVLMEKKEIPHLASVACKAVRHRGTSIGLSPLHLEVMLEANVSGPSDTSNQDGKRLLRS